MLEYKREVERAKAEGRERPRIPEYVGECVYKIANGLASRGQFFNYTYKSEMVGDGIENVIRAIANDNYDPEKWSNPFAYFTQIIFYAFLRRIEREKKQSYIRHKSLQNFYIHGLTSQHPMDDNNYNLTFDIDDEGFDDLVELFEGQATKVIDDFEKKKK